MSSLFPSQSSASVRNILSLLASRNAQLVAGAPGLERRVTWACRMRARLPAFEMLQGGELALLTLSQLRRLDETLPHLLKSLSQEGVAAVAVAAKAMDTLGEEALSLSDQLHIPLIYLPSATLLEEIEREVITFVVNFRGEVERKATDLAQQLMHLSIQGAGIKGVCEHLAQELDKWVIVEDAEQHVRFQAAPSGAELLALPATLTDEFFLQHTLARVVEPIPIRHEVVGYLSLVGKEDEFDYQERIILEHVVHILALEVARERERSQVESRYQVEALTDVLHGHYQQPEEMLTRARLLGYDLTTSQVVAIFEIPSGESDYFERSDMAQWSRRVRDELLRSWPSCWLLTEARRVVALLPLSATEEGDEGEHVQDDQVYARLERVYTRLQPQKSNGRNALTFSCGFGHVVKNLQGVPQSFREAQQALEIGRRLFGEGKLHSFARLGIYRLLFYLDGQSELSDFYYETLGPLLTNDARHDGPLIETLEGFFRCNGNLSRTAKEMNLHRNSLLYRLERIEKLLGGRSLEDAELRLSLQIALKIHHLQKR